MNNKTKKLLFIGIPAGILLLAGLRFGLYYFLSDGFSGLSLLLPLLAIGTLLFLLAACTCFAAWVYTDCQGRGGDGILWATIVFVATPFIGLLVYFLRRPPQALPCSACGHQVPLAANYCESCGNPATKSEVATMQRRTHHLGLIVTGAVCMVFMLVSLIGFVVTATVGEAVNTDISSGEKVWNMGVITMSVETNLNGVWTLNFKSASDGFVREQKFKIADSDTQKLYADITCGEVPEGATLTLWTVQGEVAQSVDVTKLESPLELSLTDFSDGNAYVRLQVNGVKDVSSKIYIK